MCSNNTKYGCAVHGGCEDSGIPCKNLVNGNATSKVCSRCTSLTCFYEPEDISVFLGMNI